MRIPKLQAWLPFGKKYILGRKIRRWNRLWRRYPARFSAATLLIGFCIGLFVQYIGPFIKPNYKIDAQTKALLGESRDDTKQYLKLSDDGKTYSFAPPKTDETDYEHSGRDAGVYEATLSTKAKNGISFTDSASKIDLTLTPRFRTASGKKTNGDHIIYPAGKVNLIYTLKYNGLKEDIVIPEFIDDELEYEFELSLPSGVEARIDSSGNIGIYSSDPTLFGSISFGSDEDRAKVDKARERGDKNHPVATIPFPIVKDADGNEYSDKAAFQLSDKTIKSTVEESKENLPAEVKERLKTRTTRNNYTLAITAKGLKDLPYPISLDPTIQSTSASDWSQGNFEEGIETDPDDSTKIRRSQLTGGNVGSWTTDNTVTPGSGPTSAIAYNGKLYVSQASQIRYATINESSGDIGAFTISPNTAAGGLKIYNGYIYAIGAGPSQNEIYYAKINADGNLGSFTQTNSWATDRNVAIIEIYSNYIYRINGRRFVAGNPPFTQDTYTFYNDVEKAPINADGSLGSWSAEATTTNIARSDSKAAVYNGRIYIAAGIISNGSGSTSTTGTVEYAKVNSDGTLSSWQTSSSTVSTRFAHGVEIISGYLYIFGGFTGINGSGLNDLRYAAIYADGSLGPFQAGTTFSTVRKQIGHAVDRNRLYIIAGVQDVNVAPTNYNDIQYAEIRPAGETGTWTTTTSTFPTARSKAGVTAYNGYIYTSGGCINCGTPGTYYNDVQYAALNADGTIGTWASAGGSFITARAYHDMVAYNGYMYITGGASCVTLPGNCTWYSAPQFSQINANGTLGSWAHTAFSNTTARGDHATAITNGYMYLIGGVTDTTTLTASVRYAPIGSNGNLSADFQATSSLPQARGRMDATVAGGRIYIAGGCTALDSGSQCTSQIDTVSYATLNTDGTISAWTNNSAGGIGIGSYDYGGLHFVNGMLYIIGRQNASPAQVKYAPINATDGSVQSPWTTANETLSMRSDWTTTSHNGYLYTLGGSDSRTSSYAPINNGGYGTLGAWTADTALNAARTHGTTVAYNGYMYHIGGCTNQDCTSNDATNTVYYTKISDNGSLVDNGTSNWLVGPSLNTARGLHTAVVVGGYIYIMGGQDNTPSGALNVEYASLNPATGAPSSWAVDSSGIGLSQLRDAAAVTHNGYIYVLGGRTQANGLSSAVSYAQALSGGGLASDAGCGSKWCVAASLPLALRFPATLVNNGYIYLLGGFDSGIVRQNKVYYASLSSPGLGSWQTAQSTLNQGRARPLAFSANGYMYVASGNGAVQTCTNTTEYAPILANGEPGKWEGTTNTIVSKSTGGGAYYQGYAYNVGGQDCTGEVNTVERTFVRSIPRIGGYSRLTDFGPGVKPTKFITRGSKRTATTVKIRYQSTNNAGNAFINNQAISDTPFYGGGMQTLDLGASISLSRYLWIRYTIDETHSSVFPDEANQTTITDYDIYFTANPGSRLKGGRTFIQGQDRGLEAGP